MTSLASRPKTASPPTAGLSRVALPAGTHPYWHDLLQRCGLVPVPALDVAAPVCLLTPGHQLDTSGLRQLHAEGTILVGDAASLQALCGGRLRPVRVQGLQGGGPLFEGLDPFRMPAELQCLDGRLAGWLPTGSNPVLLLPLPEAEALLRTPASLQPLPSITGRKPLEIVAAVDHGSLRRLVERALILAHHQAGLGYLHLRALPAGAQAGLAVRIDADGFAAESHKRVLADLQAATLRATWFIDVQRHESRMGEVFVRALPEYGQEVQSHHYRHYTFQDAERNAENIRRARETLAAWGHTCTAAAAPFGSYTGGLQAAQRDAGLAWTSEFSAIYDALPSELVGIPQVPVHPICPALLVAAGAGDAEVRTHFRWALGRRLRQREPFIVYGHPRGDLDRHPGLFGELRELAQAFARAEAGALWQPDLSELASFFAARRAQGLRLQTSRAGLRVHTDGPAGLQWLGPDGTREVLADGDLLPVPRQRPEIAAERSDIWAWQPDEPRGMWLRERLLRLRRFRQERRTRKGVRS